MLSSALVLSACNLYKSPVGTTNQNQQQQPSTAAEETITITVTDNGFEPAEASVKSGGTITWVNNSQSKIQVGSANHPTHTLNQELTGGQFVLELEPGQSSTVTIAKTGTWGYHNHLNPGTRGKVTVE